MIPLSYHSAFAIYVLLWIIVLALLWGREEIRKRKSYEWSVVKERLYLCGKCHLSFLAKHDGENVTRCPRCNEMCFIRKRKRF